MSPVETCEEVVSDFGLGGGVRQELWFPPLQDSHDLAAFFFFWGGGMPWWPRGLWCSNCQLPFSHHCQGLNPGSGMCESRQWLRIRLWFSPGTPVISNIVMIKPKMAEKSDNNQNFKFLINLALGGGGGGVGKSSVIFRFSEFIPADHWFLT